MPLEMLRLGNEFGLRYFMSEFSESLFYFAYEIVKNREVAEDIVSESFFKLWSKGADANSLDWLRSFLYIVTRNACYDYVGSGYSKAITLQVEEMLDREEDRAEILTQIIYLELLDQVVGKLKKLPKLQAEVFRMSYLEGKGTQEISEALHTTTSNVYFVWSKALSTLMVIFRQKKLVYFYLYYLYYL